MNTKKILLSLATVTSLLVSGCSDSSDDTILGGTDVPSSTTATLQGVAVDDLILNGIVTATDTSGVKLQEGRTSSIDGTYSLQLPDFTGVTVLSVECDKSSTIQKIDENGTKTSVACPTDTLFNSLATVDAGTTAINVHISPITQIVYVQAMERAEGSLADLSTEDIQLSRDNIGQMFGFDPLLTNPDTNSIAADTILAINKVAADGNITMMEYTASLADELKDTEANGADDVTVLQLTQQMASDGLINNLVDSNGTLTDLTPTDTVLYDKITNSRVFFEELRTQGYSVANNNGTGFIDTEMVDIEDTFNSIVLDTEFLSTTTSAMLDAIIGAEEDNLNSVSISVSDTITGTISRDSASRTKWTYSMGTVSTADIWSGTITLPMEDLQDANDTVLESFSTLSALTSGTLPISATSATTVESYNVNLDATLTREGFGASFVMSADITDNKDVTLSLSNIKADIGYSFVNGELQAEYAKPYSLTAKGIVKNYTLDADLVISNYVQNDGLKDSAVFQEFPTTSVGISISCSNTDVSPDNTILTLDGVDYHPDWAEYNSYNDGITTVSGINLWFDELTGDYNSAALEAGLTNSTCNDQVAYVENIDYGSNESLANAGWLPKNLTVTTKLENTTDKTYLDVVIDIYVANAKDINIVEMDDNTPDNDVTLQGTINVTGKLQMLDRPLMTVNVTLDNEASVDENKITGSYTHDNVVMNIEGTFDQEFTNGTITLNNQVGLTSTIVYDETTTLTGTVTQDGSNIGVIEEVSGIARIKYEDGTFESLP